MEQRVIDNGKINNYDLSGQLISVNDNGNIIEYIYLGNAKIAMLVDNGIDLKTYYAHNNYMNMPRLFTDEYKNVVWSGDFTPFGELYNENGSVNNVIRFAGQYENLESGYFYNYHRDYDAGLGRYLQSDPIGLNAGVNTYSYVKSNPINFVDPKGLKLVFADHLSQSNKDEINNILLDIMRLNDSVNNSNIHRILTTETEILLHDSNIPPIGTGIKQHNYARRTISSTGEVNLFIGIDFNFLLDVVGKRFNHKRMDRKYILAHEMQHIVDFLDGVVEVRYGDDCKYSNWEVSAMSTADRLRKIEGVTESSSYGFQGENYNRYLEGK